MDKKKPKNAGQNSSLDARKAAAYCLRQVMVQKRSIDGFFAKDPLFLDLSEQDRAFCQRITRSTLRHYGAIEASFASYFKRPIAKEKYIVLAHIYLAATQIAFENIPAYAAINSAVELIKKDARAFEKLVNAMLRRWLREHEDGFKENPNHNIPQWLMQKWLVNYGDDIRPIAQCLTLEPAIDIYFKSDDARGRFVDAMEENEIVKLGKSIRVNKHCAVSSLPEYEAGNWWVQDVAASLPVYLFGELKGKRALDMCAAPGGKAMQLAAAGAKVDALDSQEARLDIMKENIKRVFPPPHSKEMGDITTHCTDAMAWQPSELYDVVLLDAPCSATGTLRRNPDIKYTRSAKSLLNTTHSQKKLLKKAIEFLKPGGKLVYCVCSMEKEEGEDIIEALLKEQKNVSLANHADLLPLEILESGKLGFRTHPGMFTEDGGLDGFFMTCLEKL